MTDTPRQRIEDALIKLEKLKEDYSDENTEKRKYNWHTYRMNIEYLRQRGLLPQGLVREQIRLVEDHLYSSNNGYVAPENMARANNVLDRAIKLLSRRLEEGLD